MQLPIFCDNVLGVCFPLDCPECCELYLQDKKGKGKAMDWAAEVDLEERALEVLLGMTAKTLCRRSSAHLEQALLLVEVSLGHANLHWKMLVEQQLSRKALALAAAAAEAEKAVKAAEEAKKQAEGQQDTQMQTSTGNEAQQASQPPASTASEPTQQGSAGTAAQQEPASTPAQQPSTDTAAATSSNPAAGTSAGTSAADAHPNAPAKEAEVPDLNQDENPEPLIQSLPEKLLRHLPRLLGQSGLSDLAQRRCASIIKNMVDMCPQLKPLMLAELQDELQRYLHNHVCF